GYAFGRIERPLCSRTSLVSRRALSVNNRAENITSCAVFISSLIDATKTIKLGTGTINMPNTHPAASQIAMLDHLLDGRFIFGISPGGLLSDAEAFGNLQADARPCFSKRSIWCCEYGTVIRPTTLRGST